MQRHKKTGEALMDDSGRPLALTSHTLAAVPIAIGGKGLPEGVVFRDDMPDAGMWLRNILGYHANVNNLSPFLSFNVSLRTTAVRKPELSASS